MIIVGCMSLEERLASTDYETKKDAEAELYANAIRTGRESEVLAAIKRMTTDEILAAVAVSSNPENITKTACEKIREDKWRSAVAVYGKSIEVQKVAISEMKDQALLLEVYKTVTNEQLKVEVIEKLNPENIAKLPYSPAMAKCWKSIANQTLLGKIIIKDLMKVDKSEWKLLIDKITDSATLEKIQLALAYAYVEHYDSLSDQTRKCLISKLTDKNVIEKMITEPNKSEVEDMERTRKYKMSAIEERINKAKTPVIELEKAVARYKSEGNSREAESCQEDLNKWKAKLAQYQEELRQFKASAPRKIYVDDENGRMPLYEKFGDDSLVKLINKKMENLGDIHDGDITKWHQCYNIVQKIRSLDIRIKYYGAFLSKIAKDEVRCDGSTVEVPFFGSITSHKWGESDTKKAQLFLDSWGLNKQQDLAKSLLEKSGSGGKYLIKYISDDVLVEMIKDGKLTNNLVILTAVRKISADKLDMELYGAIRNDDIKKVMMLRMPATVRSLAEKANEAAALNLIAKAKKVNSFSLKGFYLGMNIEDAKRLVMYYLPNSNVVITKDNDIEIDVVHGGDFDVTPMYFCQADRNGNVYRFNFDKKRFLNKWFNYDVQNYLEWAEAFGKENNFDFRVREVKGKRDIKNVYLQVTQEIYQYKNNVKGFVVTYFGEKDVFDPNGEVSLDSIANDARFSSPQEAAYNAGVIIGVRLWVENGWENADGAREGTLRIEKQKEN